MSRSAEVRLAFMKAGTTVNKYLVTAGWIGSKLAGTMRGKIKAENCFGSSGGGAGTLPPLLGASSEGLCFVTGSSAMGRIT